MNIESEKSIKRRMMVESGAALPFVEDLFATPDFFKDMEFRPIATVEELKAASRVVYEEYLRLGYIDPNQAKFKFSVYQTLPTATTFIAIYKKKHVFGTLTAIEDSPLGLPMDQLYKADLDGFRAKGRHLFEASHFTFVNDFEGMINPFPTRGERLLLVLRLFTAVFDYIRSSTPIDLLVGCWHPRHEILYQFMQMKPFGEEKSYERVKGSPAVARFLDIRESCKQLHIPSLRLFFGHLPPPPKSFPKKPRFTFADMEQMYVQSSKRPSEPTAQPVGLLPTLAKQISETSPANPADVKKALGFLNRNQFAAGDTVLVFCPLCGVCQAMVAAIREKKGHAVRIDETLSSDQIKKVIHQTHAKGLLVHKLSLMSQIPGKTWDQFKFVLSVENVDKKSLDENMIVTLLSAPITESTALSFWENFQINSAASPADL